MSQETQVDTDLLPIEPIDQAAFLHFDQQFRNSLASTVLGIVERSGVSPEELALRLDWPLSKVNRLLSQAVDWDLDDAAVLAYAADGSLLELSCGDA
jgi:hypothetical protein